MTPAHLHLLLNHVPVVGLPLAVLLLLWGVVRRSHELQRAALAGVLLVSLAGVPAFLTGEPAEKQIEHAPGVTEKTIEAHEDVARVALALAALAGLLALVALVRARGGELPRGLVVSVFVVAIAASAVLGLTANRGGHIRHPEIVPGGLTTTPAATARESNEHGGSGGD